MDYSSFTLALYMILPFLWILVGCSLPWTLVNVSKLGMLLSLVDCLLISISHLLLPANNEVHFSIPLSSDLGLIADFSFGKSNSYLLILLEISFLLFFYKKRSEIFGIYTFVISNLFKIFLVCLLLSANLTGFAILQLIAATLLCLLMRISLPSTAGERNIAIGALGSFFVLQLIYSSGLLSWAVFNQKFLETQQGVPMEMSLLLIAGLAVTPMAPLLDWFEKLIVQLPSSLSLLLLVLLSTEAWRLISIAGICMPETITTFLLFPLLVSIFGISGSIIRCLSENNESILISTLLQFLFGVIWIGVGLNSGPTLFVGRALVISVIFIYVILRSPELHEGNDRWAGKLLFPLKIFVLSGMPGSPLYISWAYLAERSGALSPAIGIYVFGTFVVYVYLMYLYFRRSYATIGLHVEYADGDRVKDATISIAMVLLLFVTVWCVMFRVVG